jgi:hypothetical protein
MPLSSITTIRLQHQHEVLQDLVRGFTEQQLRTPVIPDKWSAYEQMAHLTAYQPMFYNRLKRIEQDEQPEFEPYVADNDPLFTDAVQRPLNEISEDFTTQRFILINHLVSLPDPVLRRTGVHKKYGPLSITEWTEMFLLHEAHHLFSIFQLTSQLRATIRTV